jgi:NTP pyrophosphatase (non-canonical NTP hydrolase)
MQDTLRVLLELQRQFQETYKDRFHFALHRVCTAMASESLELWAKSKGKWWSKKAHTKEEQLDELADVLHFFLLYMIKRGITVDELFLAYRKKLAENYKRQESKTY